MKLVKLLGVCLVFVVTTFGQPARTNAVFLEGDINIKFNTRNKSGPSDIYTLNINVCDSVVFKGGVSVTPFVSGTITDSNGNMTYDLGCDVLNPKNISQRKNIGKLFGSVPIDKNNVYGFLSGNLRISTFGGGVAKPLDSKFSGLALGKPPVNNSLFNRAKQEALNFTKQNKGKAVSIAVTKYDKMEFQNHVLAGGPVEVYPTVTVNGAMIYDYSRSAWYIQNVTVIYNVDGKQLADKLTGNIRWIENTTRKTTGVGEYEFDVRVNEPPVNEASLFAAAKDESAFFETDNSIPSLTGKMEYKDSFSGDTVINSNVKINLVGNQLNKQQVMYLGKLLLLSSIVPLNAE